MRNYREARWLARCAGPYVGGELSHWVDRCEKAEKEGAEMPRFPIGRDDRRQPADAVEGCARWALRLFLEGGEKYASAVNRTASAVEERRRTFG